MPDPVSYFAEIGPGGIVGTVYSTDVYAPLPIQEVRDGIVVTLGHERHPAIPSSSIELTAAQLRQIQGGGRWRWTGSRLEPAVSANDLGALKARKRGDVNAKRDALLTGGYRHNFGSSAGVRTLDTRSEQDIMNWLVLKGITDSMIATGNDADMVFLRDAGDQTFAASAQTAAGALMALLRWRTAVLTHSWHLKDQINAASSQAALNAVNIDAGWPA